MNKKILLLTAAAWFILLGASASWAQGYPWKNHAFPYDFHFGNHIDTHQQTRVQNNGDLFGYLYITFTGEITPEGLPVFEHCQLDTPPQACVAGWILRGKPGNETFVFRMMSIWLVAGRSIFPAWRLRPFPLAGWASRDAGGLVQGRITMDIFLNSRQS
jgi:hypothetical protein